VRVDDLILVSGQLAQGDDIETQARGTSEKLRKVLAIGGASMDDVVELTTFHMDMAEFQRLAKVKDEFFPRSYPPGPRGRERFGSAWAKVAVRRSGGGLMLVTQEPPLPAKAEVGK
jgi:enamine deaminase RidA (YjgF/YER057c/UK114 family)